VPALYLHIPFCDRKCPYCDFYSIEQSPLKGRFVEALIGEIRRTAETDSGEETATVYFGGGTPSLLSPQEIGRILDEVSRTRTVSDGAEITMEVNPGTVSRESLAGYRAAGVNRISIGIQSFDESDLRFLGRIHDGRQAEQCLRETREAGFTNVSLDLIYALPDQQLSGWERTLRHALEFSPEHVSAYGLIVEPGTPLHRWVSEGRVRPTDAEREAALYELTMDLLHTAEYEQYEVSNYARPGYRSRHNSSYWSHADYRGLGPSAHSFRKDPGGFTGRRWWNVRDLTVYLDRWSRGEDPVGGEELVGRQAMANERIFLGLRSDGLDVSRLRAEFGVDLPAIHPAVLERLAAEGLARWNGGLLRLTSRGYLLCDEIAGALMLA
jgi:oxygen-independent coproporphyrinogen-3 oxidase